MIFFNTQKCVSEKVRKIREFSLRTKVCWFVFKLLRRQRDNSLFFFSLYLERLNCLRCCLVQRPAFFKWGLKRESKAETTQYPFCASSSVVEFWVLCLTKTLHLLAYGLDKGAHEDLRSHGKIVLEKDFSAMLPFACLSFSFPFSWNVDMIAGTLAAIGTMR